MNQQPAKPTKLYKDRPGLEPLGEFINMYFLDELWRFFSVFFDPQKRLFIIYLCSSLLLAILWLLIVKKFNLKESFGEIFQKKIWLSHSNKFDIFIFIINKGMFRVSYILFIEKIVFVSVIYNFASEIFPNAYLKLYFIDEWTVALIFTLVMFIIDDFSKFVIHLILHKVPMFWVFHKVHHSAETLNPLTVYRIHPVESVFYAIRSLLVQSVIISIFILLFGDKVDLITIIGTNIILFIFNLTGSNLRHTHINIGYGKFLEKFLISPGQHQIHHSIETAHIDRNFGAVLAIWDYLYGSLHYSETQKKHHYGLKYFDQISNSNIINLYLLPFQEFFYIIKKQYNIIKKRVMPS